jgi:hypothetical protein
MVARDPANSEISDSELSGDMHGLHRGRKKNEEQAWLVHKQELASAGGEIQHNTHAFSYGMLFTMATMLCRHQQVREESCCQRLQAYAGHVSQP